MPTAPSVPTAAPTAPDRADRPTFSARGTAWANYQKDSLVPQMYGLALNGYANAVEANASAVAALASQTAAAASAASAAAYDNATGTSTTSMLISVANGKAFTTQAGKTWVAGMAVVAYNSAGNQMMCTVASYAGTTLTLDCTAIIGSGTVASWSFFTQPIQRIAILSAAAAEMNFVTSSENPVDSTPTHGAGNVAGLRIEWAATQFVAAFDTGTETVRTSPDGTTWTARTVTGLAAANVNFRMRGATGIAFGAWGTSATSKSTDSGVTWSAGTALPGTLTGANFMAYNSTGANGTCIVGLGGTGYVTTDNGATWSALQTFPTTFTKLLSLGTLFVGTEGSNIYTSTTGLTGSWTTTAMPFITMLASFNLDAADGLVAAGDSVDAIVYRTVNGTSWVSTGFLSPTGYGGLVNINGNYVQGSNTTTMYTKHLGSSLAVRKTGFVYTFYSSSGSNSAASNGSGVWVGISASTNTRVFRCEPSLNLSRGLFSAI